MQKGVYAISSVVQGRCLLDAWDDQLEVALCKCSACFLALEIFGKFQYFRARHTLHNTDTKYRYIIHKIPSRRQAGFAQLLHEADQQLAPAP